MTAIALTVNGRPATGDIAPRTLLADFLRDTLNLTGTHIGCAQGVCGACTVLVDDRPQRACITFAIACDGHAITTIEGHDGDPVMAELREAFSAHHALQCGFCTPGMLATARDIVLRLGDIPETRIREELSGNLCRCTGYVGIVDAIRAVCAGKSAQPILAQTPQPLATATTAPAPRTTPRAAPPATTAGSQSSEQRIRIAADPATVWAALADLRRVAACLPGADIETIDGNHVTGRMRLALGPIKAAFRGDATVTRNDTTREGRMAGSGRDGGSAASGEVTWRVLPEGDASLLVVALSWRLTGPLAQFGRGGLVMDIVRRLAADFATNLEAIIAGDEPLPARPVRIIPLLWAWLTKRKVGPGWRAAARLNKTHTSGHSS